ncbi:hypothetical protein ACA40_00470 [Pseudomonas syringae pv. lapsa]|uniref:hypothetical protein n=1 Tax=Pseudomonas syringae TaxID=317 RepID=UPI000708B186|nr:hypothetical protein [Pseudomonas syringae]ALU58411.1 hypothetical protein ACA40_00470 [Pseudomonas syringae pv. lapsa]
MDAEKIIGLPKHHKRTFVTLLFALFLLSLITTYLMDGHSATTVILDQVKSISSALITALFGFIIIVPFIPTAEKGESLEIPPGKITKEFDLLLASANRWRYKGNFGRYLRGKVLPTLCARQNIHVTACLIDPADSDLCEAHAEYRAGINAIDKGTKYTADLVAAEVAVTIVIASWYATKRNMTIEIYLSKSFDPIRIDSNDEAMILTVEDRRSPALKISRKHFTSEHFELQMRTAKDQSKKINLEGMRKNIQIGEIQEPDVIAVMNNAGLADLCTRLGAGYLLEACIKSKNPYEN